MRTPLVILTLLFVSLLLMAGYAIEESKPSAETLVTEPETSELPTMTIINSVDERVAVRVEVANTDAERQKGLMERTALAEDAGMLFVFPREQALSFWMKNTLVPLSVAFINEDGRIVDIQDMQPLDETPHPSAEPTKYALEVNQGFFEERGVKVGDRAEVHGQGSESS